MTNPVLAFAQLHFPVIFGMLMGTLARYGMVLDANGVLVPRKVLGHLMMLGLCGMLAEAFSDTLHLLPMWRACAGGGAALCASKVVERYRLFTDAQIDRRLPIDPPPAPPPAEVQP